MPLAYDVVSAASSNTALSYGVIVKPQPYKIVSLYPGDGGGNNIIIQTNFGLITKSLPTNPFGNQTKQDSIVESTYSYITKSLPVNRLLNPTNAFNTLIENTNYVYANTKSVTFNPFGNQTQQDTIVESTKNYITKSVTFDPFYYQTKQDSIVENKYGYSNTEPLIFNTVYQNKPDSFIENKYGGFSNTKPIFVHPIIDKTTEQDTIIENKYGYSNTESMVYNPSLYQTKQDTLTQNSATFIKPPAPVQVLNTSLSTVNGPGGAEAWIS
jgi:hypothetical protein